MDGHSAVSSHTNRLISTVSPLECGAVVVHAAEHLVQRRAEYESFAWEFVQRILSILMSAQTMLINRRSSLEERRAAWIGAVKRAALL